MLEQTSIDVADIRLDVWHSMLQDIVPWTVPDFAAVELLHNTMYAASQQRRYYLVTGIDDIDLTEIYEKYRTWHILKNNHRDVD